MIGAAALLLHTALMLGAALLVAGLRARVAARLLGRSGPPWAQPWRDLVRLIRKQPVLPDTTSRLFEALPFVCLAALATAALLVPSFTLGMATAPFSDLVVLAGLLTVDRCALALAGYETGTALGGMGASRISLVEVWAGLPVALVVLALATLAGTSNLDAIGAVLRDDAPAMRASLVLAGIASAIVALVVPGAGRRALLASSQDAAVLDYSGRYLAVVTYAGHLRVLVWFSLVAALFMPFGLAPGGMGPLAWGVGLGAWAVKIGALGLGAAVLDVAAGPPSAVRWLGGAAVLAAVAVVVLFVTRGPA